MNIHGGEQQEVRPGTVFDLGMTFVSAGISAYCVERAYDAIDRGIPEAGVAATGIGVIAVAFAGLSIHEWRLFRGHR